MTSLHDANCNRVVSAFHSLVHCAIGVRLWSSSQIRDIAHVLDLDLRSKLSQLIAVSILEVHLLPFVSSVRGKSFLSALDWRLLVLDRGCTICSLHNLRLVVRHRLHGIDQIHEV